MPEAPAEVVIPGMHRLMLVRFMECSRLRLRDLTLCNPASWTSAWLYSDDIVVDGITIRSRVNANGDGLDFDGCGNVENVAISGAKLGSAISGESAIRLRRVKEVAVRDCLSLGTSRAFVHVEKSQSGEVTVTQNNRHRPTK